MRETRRCFCNFSYYDQQAIRETLEDMAARGWMLEKTGSFWWTYRRMEPKKLRFSVTYFPDASEFDPGPTEGELTKLDYCRQDGWELVTRWGVMQIFCSENPDAVPIETEPAVQVENLRRSMRKNVLFPQAALGVVLLWGLAIRVPMWRRDPLGELSDPVSLYTALMYAVLILACLWEIAFYFRWSRKARLAAQNDGVFLPVRGRRTASWLLLAVSTLCLILIYSAQKLPFGFAALWLCAMLATQVLGNVLKKALKKRGAPRAVNLTVSLCGVLLLTFLFFGLLTAAILRGGLRFAGGHNVVGTYELYGRVREICDDPLPLEIEDLSDTDAQWSKEADQQETFLLDRTEYRQYALPSEDGPRLREGELKYAITRVKRGFLYDFFKRAAVNSRRDEVRKDYVFIDHYEPADPAPWGADEVYQRHWSEGVLNDYLLFWGDRIVELKFYWEPTPEQIAAAAEKLKGSFADESVSQ